MSRAQAWLALGAVAGLAAAAAALVAPGPPAGALPSGAVAVVNGTPLRAVDFERAVGALAADRRNPLEPADRRYVLDRLIEEELLLQRALELGLVRQDRRVRSELVSALIDTVVAEAEQGAPAPEQVRAFYDANREWFAQPGRLRVQQLWIAAPSGADEGARARADEAAQRLRAGEAFAAVAAALGDSPVVPVPAGLLPPAKLAEYVGPTGVEALAGLAAGAVAGPLRAAGGWQVLALLEREPPVAPSLLAIESEVRSEMHRRAGEDALRRYLEELRGRAEIRTAGGEP